ncbi:DUF3046 domain-containing protein [Agromyces arachidis]|uniref:DUF3046 domain-containing protein n=1 Tax=Agromyces arachidis TaxID=766966 RepID=UPI004057A1EA
MKRSEFTLAIEQEFGAAYGGVVVNDLVLAEVGGRTAAEALADGVAPRDVWFAICRATDVPESRRHGAGRPLPRERG